MDLLAAWLLYPLALAVLCLGLGLLVERATDWRLPGVLLLPVGFAALLVLARLVTDQRATAPFGLALAGLAAVLGLALGYARLRALRPDPWILAAALGIFLVFAAPVLASGEPSLAGYLALPDTGHQLALAQLLADRGPDWESLREGSTYEGLAPYLIGHYPVASQALLGITAPLGIIDLAWLYQPLLSFVALLLFLSLAALVAPVLRHRWQRALVPFAAAQPALVYAYALQGSIKEMTIVAVIACLVALAATAILERRSARCLVAVAVVAAAALGTLGPAALAFICVPGAVVLAVWAVRLARERSAREFGWLIAAAAVAVALALPVLTTLGAQIEVNGATLDAGVDRSRPDGGDLGNLAEPLELVQALGVWFTGDYRYKTQDPTLDTLEQVALWLAGALAVLGLAWAIRRRAWGALLFAAVLLPSIYLLHRGAPYADAKVMMIVSPAIMLLAMLGATSLWTGRWRALSALATGALLAAIAGSTALAYHDASLLPHDRYEEMRSIEARLAGRGPALLNEYDEFAKYFLAGVPAVNEPESNHAFRGAPYRGNAMIDRRRRPSLKTPTDIDDIELRYVQRHPYIILRRSPVASRPPANYRRVWRGEFYDVWRRGATPRVLDHVPLGRDVLRPAGPVSEATARAAGRRARELGGRIAYVPRPRPAMHLLARHPRPLRWGGFGDFPFGLVTDGPGHTKSPVRIRRGGSYTVWVEGSFERRLTLLVDGRAIGRTPRDLNNPGAYARIATIDLKRGAHGVEVLQAGGNLRPGNGGYRSSLRHIGPILFQPAEDDAVRVRVIAAGRWRRLVGVRSDWIEIVRR